MPLRHPSRQPSAAAEQDPTASQLAWDIFNSSPIATLVIEPTTGAIVDANQVALNLLGSSRDQLRVTGMLALVGRETRRDLRTCLDEAVTDSSAHVTLPFERPDGTRFWTRLAVCSMGTSPTHAVATIVDIEQLVIETTTDPLTGLATRDALEPAIRQALLEPGSCASVMFVDLDSFKQLNDSFGHQAGDDMIKRVASCLRASVRADDLVARYGGDEFMIVMPGVTNEGRIHAVARHIRDHLTDASTAEGFKIGASIGVAIVDDRDCDPADVMVTADSAMYEAKKGGGGKVVIRRFETEHAPSPSPRSADQVEIPPVSTPRQHSEPNTAL